MRKSQYKDASPIFQPRATSRYGGNTTRAARDSVKGVTKEEIEMMTIEAVCKIIYANLQTFESINEDTATSNFNTLTLTL